MTVVDYPTAHQCWALNHHMQCHGCSCPHLCDAATVTLCSTIHAAILQAFQIRSWQTLACLAMRPTAASLSFLDHQAKYSTSFGRLQKYFPMLAYGTLQQHPQAIRSASSAGTQTLLALQQQSDHLLANMADGRYWLCSNGWRCTVRFESSAKVRAECTLKHYEISRCVVPVAHMIKEDFVEVVIGDGLAIADVIFHNLLGRAFVAASSEGLPF